MKKQLLKKIGSITLATVIVFTSVNLTNFAEISKVTKAASTSTVLKSWSFDKSEDGWYYGKGWEYKYQGAANSGVSYDAGKLKVDVDFTKDSGESWSSMAACVYDDAGMKLAGANKVSMDFYYDTSKMTTGNFIIKVFSNAGVNKYSAVDMEKAENVSGTLKKVPFEMDFDTINSSDVKDFAVCIVGNQTDYKGSFWLDNIKLLHVSNSSEKDVYVNSKVSVTKQKPLYIKNGKLITQKTSGKNESTSLSKNVTLVDKNATAQVKQIYSYLNAVGKSSSAIFGHQNDTHHKAGDPSLSSSDSYDVTGSYSGVIGIDALSLTGNEYSANRYNKELRKKLGGSKIAETAVGNVKAAAKLTNFNIKSGAIITLSAHMPNFSTVKKSGKYDGKHSYSKYDFSGYSPNLCTGDVMNQILPGGKYNTVYNAYLDMLADYANQVNGAILFRPFHENTGSWFWWGAAYCDAATYKNVYKYTVEYLRDAKNIHNLIYVYGPSSEAASTAEYGVRYPGDNYVDMVGFDMYHIDPQNDDPWFSSFKKELAIVESFAQKHNKLFAVTETGVATSTPDLGDNQTALHKTGNKQLNWYQKMQTAVAASNASYFLVWANFSEKDGFYTPYVKSISKKGTLFGHEMLDNFIKYYNNPSSIFAADQKKLLTKEIKKVSITTKATTTKTFGYITAPVSGTRILSPTSLTARVTNSTAKDVVKFILNGKVKKEILARSEKDGVTYTSKLDAATLTALGEDVGSIELFINGVSQDKITISFNIPIPVEDPYKIDGYEDYYGVNTLLTKKWTVNKNTGDTISISLSSDAGTFNTGKYAMKFTYDEAKNGWTGATISKTVDWSSCNALQFFTIPDGNNQKVVVQITANNKVYEVYMNNYEGYKNKKTPILVTIPFSDFVERDTAGNPKGGLTKDCNSVSSFGLWVNAIDGTPAIINDRVTGTIYYDDITAVKTDKTTASFEAK
jgi:Beta-mannanase